MEWARLGSEVYKLMRLLTLLHSHIAEVRVCHFLCSRDWRLDPHSVLPAPPFRHAVTIGFVMFATLPYVFFALMYT